jgi:hypothetical protein
MNLSPLIAQMSAEPVEVQSLWAGFDGDQRFVLAIIGVTCLTLILIVLGCVTAAVWSAVRTKQIDADLRRDMLDRGMTADEIDKVMSSQFSHWWGGLYYKK